MYSCAQGHELPQSHCEDNREESLFSRSDKKMIKRKHRVRNFFNHELVN